MAGCEGDIVSKCGGLEGIVCKRHCNNNNNKYCIVFVLLHIKCISNGVLREKCVLC